MAGFVDGESHVALSLCQLPCRDHRSLFEIDDGNGILFRKVDVQPSTLMINEHRFKTPSIDPDVADLLVSICVDNRDQ